MTRLEKAAIEVHKIMWNNTGIGDEWPISVLVAPDIHDRFSDAMNELRAAADEVQPGIGTWPRGKVEI